MSTARRSLDLSCLVDTVCVVTGAGNGGIGYGICEIAADLGLHIAVVDLFPKVAESAAKRLQDEHPSITVRAYGCDVTKPEALEAVVKTLPEDFGWRRIGAVFANAGVLFPNDGIMKAKLGQVRQTMEVNVVGVVATAQAFVPLLRQSTEPSVFCTTASIGGLMFAGLNLQDYCASKHAVVLLTEALGLELAAEAPQIRVHVCCPCLVRTGLMVTSRSTHKTDADKVEAFDPSTSPQAVGSAEDMAGLFLTPRSHGQQVWDRIAMGEFYMICDNIRPYVDHDFAMNGHELAQQRAALLAQPDFERCVDFNKEAFAVRGKSPLLMEMARRGRKVGAASKL